VDCSATALDSRNNFFRMSSPGKNSELVEILAAGSISVPVLPRAQAKKIAAVSRSVRAAYAACLEQAALNRANNENSHSKRSFYLGEMLRVSEEDVIVLFRTVPSSSTSPDQARMRAAADRMHQYQQAREAKQKSQEDEKSRIANDPVTAMMLPGSPASCRPAGLSKTLRASLRPTNLDHESARFDKVAAGFPHCGQPCGKREAVDPNPLVSAARDL
jgi:hypothetical protein